MDLEHGGVEDPVPEVIREDGSISDSESGSSSKPDANSFLFNSNGLIRVKEGAGEDILLKERFLSSVGSLAKHCTVVAVHKVTHLDFLSQARLRTFQIHAQAMSKKCAGEPNIKCAWYGSSVEGICGIVNHGFGPCERPENGGLYGSGAYLSPETSAIDSVVSSIADDNGLRHVLFCRVILGNSEEVRPGSMQYQPSSVEFDSGVDNLLAPKRYIIWSTHMNTHILPQYVLSVKLSFGLRAHDEPVRRPSSAWMPLPALISAVSRLLPPSTGA
ncbi:putative inactive poly [ADP-ribose] polymerase SRO5 [Acorus calamus]|uniref:Inactive poly [ADP-ribose] polymerase SRO5 n=1 Tax=Acorus calamus TaxID=4465 RepID=A0AAV9DDZ9_ACOCL|nr:putative inactive poly [ADP-ribose] polymerase SRO5 [Acorus calamus]